MHLTRKLFDFKNIKGFLIKNLAHLANRIGQTLQVFYPVFVMTDSLNSYVNQKVSLPAPPATLLGYFIISMAPSILPHSIRHGL